METNVGAIDVELYDSLAPITVANFLNYAGRGDYNGIIIHRSTPGFVIQGGGYKCCNSTEQFYHIPPDPPIPNEFDPSRSNVRGTIAMAKGDNDPNSATSEWFFNLANNGGSPNTIPQGLDFQNGGFTVFGCVLNTGLGTCTGSGSGMKVVDAIAALQRYDFGAPFDTLPLINYDPTVNLQAQLNNLVTVTNISKAAFTSTIWGTLATFTADLDMTFNAAGTVPPDLAVPLLATFSSPPAQYVNFNNGMFRLLVSGSMGSGSHIVTLYDGSVIRPTHYYAYGRTPDNPIDHWYDFSYDSTTRTGAEIGSDRITLHFVDGKRGDEDLTANNSIMHVGAQVVLGPPPPTQTTSASSGGCSITTNKSSLRGGDWLLVSLFLVMLALMRRRARGDRDTIGN